MRPSGRQKLATGGVLLLLLLLVLFFGFFHLSAPSSSSAEETAAQAARVAAQVQELAELEQRHERVSVQLDGVSQALAAAQAHVRELQRQVGAKDTVAAALGAAEAREDACQLALENCNTLREAVLSENEAMRSMHASVERRLNSTADMYKSSMLAYKQNAADVKADLQRRGAELEAEAKKAAAEAKTAQATNAQLVEKLLAAAEALEAAETRRQQAEDALGEARSHIDLLEKKAAVAAVAAVTAATKPVVAVEAKADTGAQKPRLLNPVRAAAKPVANAAASKNENTNNKGMEQEAAVGYRGAVIEVDAAPEVVNSDKDDNMVPKRGVGKEAENNPLASAAKKRMQPHDEAPALDAVVLPDKPQLETGGNIKVNNIINNNNLKDDVVWLNDGDANKQQDNNAQDRDSDRKTAAAAAAAALQENDVEKADEIVWEQPAKIDVPAKPLLVGDEVSNVKASNGQDADMEKAANDKFAPLDAGNREDTGGDRPAGANL